MIVVPFFASFKIEFSVFRFDICIPFCFGVLYARRPAEKSKNSISPFEIFKTKQLLAFYLWVWTVHHANQSFARSSHLYYIPGPSLQTESCEDSGISASEVYKSPCRSATRKLASHLDSAYPKPRNTRGEFRASLPHRTDFRPQQQLLPEPKSTVWYGKNARE